jgi:hypothetical protein
LCGAAQDIFLYGIEFALKLCWLRVVDSSKLVSRIGDVSIAAVILVPKSLR